MIARSQGALNEIADEINQYGANVVTVVADVGVKNQVEAAAAKAINAFGRIGT